MNGLRTSLVLSGALLAVFVEATWDLPRLWLGAQVNLLAPLIVYAAVSTDLATTMLAAVLGGLWTDGVSANPLGVSALPLLGLGFALHRWQDLLLRELSYAQVILGGLVCAAAPLLSVLVLWGIGEQPLVGWGSLWQWAVGTLAGAAVTPVVFYVLDRLYRAFAYVPVTVTAFRPDREIKRGRY